MFKVPAEMLAAGSSKAAPIGAVAKAKAVSSDWTGVLLAPMRPWV